MLWGKEDGERFGGVYNWGGSVFDDGGGGVVDECFDGACGLSGFKDVFGAFVVDLEVSGGREGEGIGACCVKDHTGTDLEQGDLDVGL